MADHLGARVRVPALTFGQAWAKQQFPQSWRTVQLEATIIGQVAAHKWKLCVDYDGDTPEVEESSLFLLSADEEAESDGGSVALGDCEYNKCNGDFKLSCSL